jgi:hypothetical protein
MFSHETDDDLQDNRIQLVKFFSIFCVQASSFQYYQKVLYTAYRVQGVRWIHTDSLCGTKCGFWTLKLWSLKLKGLRQATTASFKIVSYLIFVSSHQIHIYCTSVFFCGEGPPQQKLRTHRSLKAYCATLWWRWREKLSVFFIFPSNVAPVERNWQRKTKVFGGKTCPSATLSNKNFKWIDPGSNPGLRGGRPATNRLSHVTALSSVTLQSIASVAAD